MKIIFISTCCILICFAFSNSFAGDIVKEGNNESQYFKPTHLTELSATYFNPLNSLTYQDTLTKEQQLAQMPGYKLPKRALFFSALIPGAGELYAKSYIKAGAFFLAEVAAWTIYGSYTNKGKDEEKKYQAYADAHWDPEVWKQWKQNYTYSLDDAHASTMEKYLSGEGQKVLTPFYGSKGKLMRSQRTFMPFKPGGPISSSV